MSQSAFNVGRIIKAFGHACAGLKAVFESEAAFRQELIACAVLIPVALSMHLHAAQRALLIGSLLLVLIVEVLNSAIEATIDRISTEQHPLSKKAKDLGSAAVFLSILNAGIIWVVVLFG